MTVRSLDRQQVRQRAQYRCEFCGVSETDSGAELTVDHFRPSTKGGSDSLGNLVYACNRCNQHKLDYWPETSQQPKLWNPREDAQEKHFVELGSGALEALTDIGEFTIQRLRLNRAPLVEHRKRKRQTAEEVRLLQEYRRLNSVLEQLLAEQANELQEQKRFLVELSSLVKILLDK